jgi:hypothetical protein
MNDFNSMLGVSKSGPADSFHLTGSISQGTWKTYNAGKWDITSAECQLPVTDSIEITRNSESTAVLIKRRGFMIVGTCQASTSTNSFYLLHYSLRYPQSGSNVTVARLGCPTGASTSMTGFLCVYVEPGDELAVQLPGGTGTSDTRAVFCGLFFPAG